MNNWPLDLERHMMIATQTYLIKQRMVMTAKPLQSKSFMREFQKLRKDTIREKKMLK